MPAVHQRGTPAVYVAASARELPADVQEWLGRADTRAVASPHIYDLLAELARGKRFSAVIVSIQSVDWTEMEFFDIVARLSRDTPVFITGSPQQRAKLEAACRRGAHLFDADLLNEELSAGPGALRPGGHAPIERPTGFVADESRSRQDAAGECAETPDTPEFDPSSVRSSQAAWPRMRLAEAYDPATEAEELETGFLDDEAPAGPDAVAEPEPSDSAEDESAETEWVVDDAEPAQPEGRSTEAAGPATDAPDRPGAPEDLDVRVADRQAPAEGSAGDDANDLAGDSGPPVVFPWSANPNRPKRTPPPQGESIRPTGPTPLRPTGQFGPAEPPLARPSDSPFRSVRLTPEEMAALMGRPPGPQTPEARL